MYYNFLFIKFESRNFHMDSSKNWLHPRLTIDVNFSHHHRRMACAYSTKHSEVREKRRIEYVSSLDLTKWKIDRVAYHNHKIGGIKTKIKPKQIKLKKKNKNNKKLVSKYGTWLFHSEKMCWKDFLLHSKSKCATKYGRKILWLLWMRFNVTQRHY